MQESTLKEKTAKGLFWGGLSSGLQQVLQFVFGLIMIRLLCPEEYGIVAVLTIFQAVAWMLLDCGLGVAIINKDDANDADYNALFWFSSIISSASYIILFFASPFIADFYNKPELNLIARVYFLSILVTGFSTAQGVMLLKELKYKEKAIIDFLSILVSGAVGVTLAYTGFSYWALVIQNVLFQTVASVFRCFFAKWRPLFKIDLTPLKNMFAFSIKLFFTGIINALVNNVFSFLLGKFYSIKDAGLYSQGNKWSSMGSSFINGMITNVALPILTQLKEEKERQLNAIRKMLRFGAFISFPLLFGLAFVSDEFLLIIGKGTTWQAASPYLQLFSIWFAFYYIWILFSNLVLTHSKSGVYMWTITTLGVLKLLIIVVMYPFGIFPMVIAYIISNFLGLLVWNYHVNKLIGLKLWQVIKDIAPYLIVAIGSIAIAWFVTAKIENIMLRFISKIIITALIYICVMWFSDSVIVKESVSFIKGKIKLF
jgi:O-antigen/teichoic acid export membrane protein